MLWTKFASPAAGQRLAAQNLTPMPGSFAASSRNPSRALVILLACGVPFAAAAPARSQNPSSPSDSRQQVSDQGPDAKRIPCCTTTTTLTSSLNPTTKGQNILFTARVVGSNGVHPAGTVDFYIGSTLFVTRALTNGVAAFGTAALPAGTMDFRAIFTGATDYDSSTSATLVQVVRP